MTMSKFLSETSLPLQPFLVWGGALRDGTKNGCEGNYSETNIRVFYYSWKIFNNILRKLEAIMISRSCSIYQLETFLSTQREHYILLNV